MKFKELGRTGVRLPTIGLGTWRYQGGVEALRAGVNMGARFIDTAESYGTEDIVRQAIQGIRKEVFLATKVSPRNFRRAAVLRSADGSLKRLKTDYIDLYQLHWPNHTVPVDETMSAMEELVDRGKVRFIGVSNFTVRELKGAQKAMTRHTIASKQVRYNLIDRTAEFELLSYCQKHDITVIAHSPLANSFESIQARDPGRVIERIGQDSSRNQHK